MSLTFETRVGKKFAIYLPKAVVEAVGLSEGEKILVKVSGNRIMLEVVRDPIQLAISGKKFASLKPKQVEVISVEEQKKYIEGSS
jgi:AbrB family looped-hinge helix DNA binding protein